MFLFKDLGFYKNEYFRSLSYLTKAWEEIEGIILFYLGMFNDINISIIIESKSVYITLTSNFKTYISISKNIKVVHSLSMCTDFYTEIDINVVTNCKSFSCKILKNNFYYNRSIEDEGVVEFKANFCFKFLDYYRFKNIIFTNLSKEIQYAIHKNIFYLNIEEDCKSEIDAEFEALQACIFLNMTLEESFKYLTCNNIVQEKNVSVIKTIEGLIHEK